MTIARYKAPPDVISSTVLRDYLSVILPIERTNLILNPSFETNTAGYTSVDGATLTRTTEEQRRGVFSLKVKPGLSQTSGLYHTTSSLTAGTAYVFSCDVFIRGGAKYTISIYDGIRTVVQRQIVGKGYWERVSIGAVMITAGAHRLYLQKDGHNDTREFYTDGWQLEACAAGEMFPTTYIDGDLNGFVVNQVPSAFYWTGEPHASTSIRSAQTRAGGRVVNLKEYSLQVLALIGLGMSPVNNVATPLGLIGGAVYQRTVPGVRGFTIVASLSSDNRAQLDRNRRMLEDAFKPDAVSIQQPLVLRYQNMDCDNPNGEEVDIICNYAGGLEGSIDNFHQERLGIKFTSYYPYVTDDGEQGAALDFADNITGVGFIMQRRNNGAFASLGNALNGNVWSFAEGLDGSIYLGGYFVTIGGLTFNRIAKWSPSTGMFSTLGSGTNGSVRGVLVGIDGSLYITGEFTLAGGVAGTSYIARWTGSTWQALGTGLSGGQGVCLAMDIDGNIYVGGIFTSAGGVANTDGIAKWNVRTQVWEALGTGVSGGTVNIQSIVRALDGSMWAAGMFDEMGGIPATRRIARWTGTVWQSIANSIDGYIVRALGAAPNGLIYAGGDFTVINGVTASRIAYYNGTNWFALSSGVNGDSYAIVFDGRGNVLVGGSGTFTTAGGLTLIDKWAIWNGTSWVYGPANLPGPSAGSDITTLFISRAYDWYIAYNESASIATSGGISEVKNDGLASVAPKFIFYGPGQIIQLDNFNTSDSIWFNLILVSGERAILDLTPGNISFKSNVRGSLLGKILPGSKLTSFRLQPGANRIGAFIKDAGIGTAVYLNWRNTHWDIVGSIRR